VTFNKFHIKRAAMSSLGFTLIEAIVGISVLGIGVASTVGTLTKFNSIADSSRNSTGAYTVVINQIDVFQSMSPFNPQKTNDDGTIQVPKFVEPANNPGGLAAYDMTIGTHTIGYKDPATGIVSDKWPVYQYKDPNTGTVIVVNGTLTITVVAEPSVANTYRATVTVTYDYLNHRQANTPPNPYTFSMSTIRSSDI
jgi:type II secretory pathway pseudopilin PulG